MSQVALITGGTSGIGLDVAKRLSETGDWQVNIIGSNQQRGLEAMSSLANTIYYQADVRNYEQLAKVFETIQDKAGRLDFVFANAGVAGRTDFFAAISETGIPPEPSLDSVHINLDGLLYTSYLAMHYFRRSPESTKGKRNLIMNSSIAGLYPCALSPAYTASKHGIVGFARSIGKKLWEEGIRVNAICPGVVKTAVLTEELEKFFPDEIIIPLEVVTELVMDLLSGRSMTDAREVSVPADEMHSKALLVSGHNFYFIDQPEIHDELGKLTYVAMNNI
ncbi:15-hydroxyprostaglandin dehydrogenase [NAD] [Penicillium rolfsii]|nr:15-hydroxyprostaglandin dehydrogenase [NAD] [Penicillium rolfsii]